MDINTLAIYIHELRNQVTFTQGAFQLFNQSLEQRASTGLFLAGQGILTSSSQVAGLLWPTRARSRNRGEQLRQVLKLPEKHTLNDRRLSELWEHSDQKTEEWIAHTKGRKIVFDFIGPPEQLGQGELEIDCIYRVYDPGAKIFYFRGIGYNMQAIANAVADVGNRVLAAHRQLFPDQETTQPPTAVETASVPQGPAEPVDTPPPDEAVPEAGADTPADPSANPADPKAAE